MLFLLRSIYLREIPNKKGHRVERHDVLLFSIIRVEEGGNIDVILVQKYLSARKSEYV